MRILSQGPKQQTTTVKGLAGAAKKNKYPDVLFFAGGISYDPTVKAKIRIKLAFDGGDTIKKWKEKVEYVDIDGTPFGNMFDAKLVTSDDMANSGIVFSVEIDVGQGYEVLDWTSIEWTGPSAPTPGVPGVYSNYFTFVNAAGTAGCVLGLTYIQ